MGRYLFAAATVAAGIITLLWHDFDKAHHLWFVVWAAAAAQIVGGVAMPLPRTAKAGAIVVALAYCVFVAMAIPAIVNGPLTYNNWGNLFEQVSLVVGALIALVLPTASAPVRRAARFLLGICCLSFACEQAFYLSATASFVPHWIPPNAMFWAQATTVLFVLGAAALFANVRAPLAAYLLTAMLVLFGLIVWVPLILSNAHSGSNWSETAETFAIAGALWALGDLLGGYRRVGVPSAG